jgi:dCTP deaminase
MAYWSSRTLKERIRDERLITPYDEDRVTHCAYEMGVGSEAFITSNPSDRTQLAPGAKIVIPPGQFGLLVTKEVVAVPLDSLAFISIRAGIKFRGLVNVSGFHVDPGFKGQLKFAVYNAGSQDIVLDQDQRVFMIWYCELDDIVDDPYANRTPSTSVITADDVTRIHGDVASPAELKKRIDEIKADYDKRIHSVEKEQSVLRWFLGGLVLLFIGSYVRPLLEARKEGNQPPAFPAPIAEPRPNPETRPAPISQKLGEGKGPEKAKTP